MPRDSEFSLHVHRIGATAKHEPLYTIGIWEGTTLHAICHVQRIEGALASIRCLLEQIDQHESEPSLLRCNKRPVSTPGALRKLRIGTASFFAALLRPLR